MYEKTNFPCLTMQRYDEKSSQENPFSESPQFFNESAFIELSGLPKPVERAPNLSQNSVTLCLCAQ